MSQIKIITNTASDTVVCTFSNGAQVEIEMIDVIGEELLRSEQETLLRLNL